MNQIILVGRLTNIEEKEQRQIITLACSRPLKNENGEYETDLIDFVLWKGIADTTKEYCKKGDVVGVKGRIQTRIVDGHKYTDLIAEKITFFSTKKGDG